MTPQKDHTPNTNHSFNKSLNNFIIPEIAQTVARPWDRDPSVVPQNVKPRILSIVGSVRIGIRLSLETIAGHGKNLRYVSSQNYSYLKLTINNPYAVAMVFPSGNIVINGTTSMTNCKLAAKKFTAIIRSCGFRTARPVLQVQNISAIVNLGFRIHVHKMATSEHLKGRVFASENFSGITVEMGVPKAKIILFQTGRILITGVVSEQNLREALDFIYPIAKNFSK